MEIQGVAKKRKIRKWRMFQASISIYLNQYLELWKQIIFKLTGLNSVFWEHKYFSWDLSRIQKNSAELSQFPYLAGFLQRPVYDKL